MVLQAYDNFSSDYDRFVNWQARLAYELPFISSQIGSLGSPVKLLDAACGTGMHAIALKQRGFDVVGADISEGMVDKARHNAHEANVEIPFEKAGFGELADIFSEIKFDAVLCLGNSLPHVVTSEMLRSTLADFAQCLRPGGLLLIQNRNFDLVMMQHQRWMEPQSYHAESKDWLFLRFYDFLHDGTIQFNILTLQHRANSDWTQEVTSTKLHPWLQDELSNALKQSGFTSLEYFGDMTGVEFVRSASGNLIITALKTRRP